MKKPTLKDISCSYDPKRPDKIDLGDGYYATVDLPYDEDHGPPWKESDCHGPVSDWTTRDKRPGEWVLCTDRRSKRYYDHAEAVRIARRDGWGVAADERIKLEAKLGRPMTKGELAAAAVMRDFDYLQGWCNDEWHWVGVVVTIFNAEDEEVFEDSLWGIEDNTDYWKEVALGMIETGVEQIEKEIHEAAYWAARDTITA